MIGTHEQSGCAAHSCGSRHQRQGISADLSEETHSYHSESCIFFVGFVVVLAESDVSSIVWPLLLLCPHLQIVLVESKWPSSVIVLLRQHDICQWLQLMWDLPVWAILILSCHWLHHTQGGLWSDYQSGHKLTGLGLVAQVSDILIDSFARLLRSLFTALSQPHGFTSNLGQNLKKFWPR